MFRRLLRLAACATVSLAAAGCGDDPVAPGVTEIPGSIILNTQTDVDKLEGVREIDGDLRIDSGYELRDPITSLAPLRTLRRIGGHLRIEDNERLEDLGGLAGLELIGGELQIGRDAVGGRLTGMTSLRAVDDLDLQWFQVENSLAEFLTFRVYDRLTLRNTPWIVDLGALAGQTRVRTLELWGLASLRNLEGLARMDSLRTLNLQNLDSVESLAGWPELPSLETLSLRSMGSLADLEGLPALPRLRTLELHSAPLVESLDSFPFPDRPFRLTVRDCPRIETIAGGGAPVLLERLAVGGCEAFAGLAPGVVFTDRFSLTLEECPSLTSFATFPADSACTTLSVADCASLSDWSSGFDLVQSEDYFANLRLERLPHLTGLDWLDLNDQFSDFHLVQNPGLGLDLAALPIVSVGYLEIVGNPGIDQCAAEAWAEALPHTGWHVQVEDNGPCAD